MLLAACGNEVSVDGDAPGLLFDQIRQDLGTLVSGEDRELRFGFEVVDAAVRVHQVESSCGCVDVRLIDANGQPMGWGQSIAPGTRGELVAVWKTAGYVGTRESTLRLLGEGPGLPITLRFTGELEPWIRPQPDPVSFTGPREEEERLEVRLAADEPFRLLDVLVGIPGLRVEGLPSAEAAREQSLTIIREADSFEEGRTASFLQFRTDVAGRTAAVPVEIIQQSAVWARPASRWLLGAVAPGTTASDAWEIGCQEGVLEVLGAEISEAPGVEAIVETLDAGARCRIRLALPPDLASEALRGTIRVRLAHRVDGRESLVDKEIQFFGVVRTP